MSETSKGRLSDVPRNELELRWSSHDLSRQCSLPAPAMQIPSLLCALVVALALVGSAVSSCTYGVHCSYGPKDVWVYGLGGRNFFGANATANGLHPASVTAAVMVDAPYRPALISRRDLANYMFRTGKYQCLNYHCHDTHEGFIWPPTFEWTWEYNFAHDEYNIGIENNGFLMNDFKVFFDIAVLPKLYPFRSLSGIEYCGTPLCCF